MRIVLTGGGTGGHLIPFEPIIESLRTVYLEQKDSLPERIEPTKLDLFFIGIVDDKTRTFFKHYDVAAYHVPSGKLRRYASHLTFFDMLGRLPVGIVKALYLMWKIMPDVIVSKGGYGSIPVLIAAAFYRIPFLLHESDAVSGLANRLAARFAAAITVGFAATREEMSRYQHKTFVTGTPVRHEFGRVSVAEAKQAFGFKVSDMVILVVGGSQGALALNEVLLQVLPELILQAGIIHITGDNHFTKITTVANELLESSSRKEFYKAYPYLTDTVIEAMTAADIVVSRAGATTLAELTRLRKPSLLIPLPGAAYDHQRLNAQIYERAGAARVLDPANLGRNLFLRSLTDLLEHEYLRHELARALTPLDHPQAGRDIALLTFKLAMGLVPVLQEERG
ncbi:MAG: UDP-N-acetylglucosamine--N-acetylmuramyl-(pentapeptide) pyrophosphoryl-undecaprenol N-acetylglucosamine transferase [Candidatus Andersenbacteria bacterium]